jgi:hypothetical protein
MANGSEILPAHQNGSGASDEAKIDRAAGHWIRQNWKMLAILLAFLSGGPQGVKAILGFGEGKQEHAEEVRRDERFSQWEKRLDRMEDKLDDIERLLRKR